MYAGLTRVFLRLEPDPSMQHELFESRLRLTRQNTAGWPAAPARRGGREPQQPHAADARHHDGPSVYHRPDRQGRGAGRNCGGAGGQTCHHERRTRWQPMHCPLTIPGHLLVPASG